MLDEQDFRLKYEDAMTALFKALAAASDEHDFEADFNNGTLTVEFEEPRAKFVISPQTPVRQVWVSAHSRSFSSIGQSLARLSCWRTPAKRWPN